MALAKNDFNFNTFEAQWVQLSEEDKALVVKDASHLSPEQAILPVLSGIASLHFEVRNNARENLFFIQEKISKLLSDPDDTEQYSQGQKISSIICSKIYAKIYSELPFQELSFFVKILLDFKEKGAYFVFQLLYRKLSSVEIIKKIILTLPEASRLVFVNQYIQASPEIRLKFGFAFKRILESIQQRDVVIDFYVDLFDAKKNIDPFFNNIDPELRNPEKIIINEIQSGSSEKKIKGLKALSMIKTKIPVDLLVDSLTNQENKKIRIVIYSIVENSSVGVYAQLFSPILHFFNNCDRQEAFEAFKALIVTGKQPIYKLLELAKNKSGDLLPLIKMEISKLSKISFFFIQDIALNKKQYSSENFEINLACVLGMIMKRPERVVRILKQYENASDDALRMDVIKFIKKTKNILELEKQDIEKNFDLIVQKVKDKSIKSKGVITSFFLDSIEKKLKELKTSKTSEVIDFQNEIIKDIDFSSSKFTSASSFFNQSILNNCDFSDSFFSNAYFKAAIFYNIDMQNIQFDSVNFDNAVFININAKGAHFNRCSFQNIKIFNCNFSDARFINASFINSTISKTSFNQANLYYSCFAYSKLSAVSFETSNIDQADFTSVKARFCRFPTNINLSMQTSGIDYNARKFQLLFQDIPQMDEAIVAQINMLIFSEFIHYGEKKFLNQNQLSLLTAFDIFKSDQADLFQIIPFLIHENVILPGFNNLGLNNLGSKDSDFKKVIDKAPCGIYDYVPGIEVQEVLKKYVSRDKIVVRRSKNHAVEGLFTIGSTGSLAQTSDSDIDWWVCINEDNFTDHGLKLFQRKLKILEKIADKQFNTKVTFFLVDILKTRNNDFGDSTIESSGSAQARLLKEEFYRTMIYVAGKIPLWSVLPTSISINYYNSILKTVSGFSNFVRYIDLGDIHAISTNEYVGASIWQMFKWLKSPFKSVIKMTLLEKFIYEYGKKSLLCNKYKDEWMNSGVHLKFTQNDSYYILLKNLLEYYDATKDNQSKKLLLTCFFLKLGISKDSQIENSVFGFKKILLEKCMNEWGWTKNQVFEIGSFKTWRYSDIVKLSNFIETYMVKKYKKINKAFESILQGHSGISPEDQTMLVRKVLVEFSKQQGKVGKILLISRSDRHFQSLQLKMIQEGNHTGAWQLLNKNTKAIENKIEILINATTIEEIGAWLINNSLYNNKTIINLIPNSAYVTFDDIRKLYKTMYEVFNPLLKKAIDFDQLLMKNRVVCLFVSINFYTSKQDSKVSGYCAIYLNSWGEMFCKSSYYNKGAISLDATKKDIMKAIGVKQLPLNTVFYFAKGVAR